MSALAKSASLVENQPLIAVDLETLLLLFGMEGVVTFTSCRSAMDWLSDHTPVFAVLEPDMDSKSCDAVAGHLIEKSVAFVIQSVEIKFEEPHPSLSECSAWLDKPIHPDRFGSIVRQVAVRAKSARYVSSQAAGFASKSMCL